MQEGESDLNGEARRGSRRLSEWKGLGIEVGRDVGSGRGNPGRRLRVRVGKTEVGELHLVGEVFGVQWGRPPFPSALLPTRGPPICFFRALTSLALSQDLIQTPH